jgi:lysophospholipase L1-like esterase
MIWYEDEIKRIEKLKEELDYKPDLIFYGSSSITRWPNISRDFEEFKVANFGFGGSTLAACTWYFERVFAGCNPKYIIMYAGDNDLGDGRHSEEVMIFLQQIQYKINTLFGPIPCAYISIKPSISRWNIIEKIKYTNNIIGDYIKKQKSNWYFIDIFNAMLDEKGFPGKIYFEPDGLHLSKAGYELWREIIRKYTSTLVH